MKKGVYCDVLIKLLQYLL